MTMNQCFTFPWQLTLRSLINGRCGIVGRLEKISKTNSQGVGEGVGIVGGLEKTKNFHSRGVGF